jgi:hypothetical protein
MSASAQTPWYREPWTWGLMAGPAGVIVAGVFTLTLAVRSNDGVVADDYYKQGLEVNQVLSRDHRAQVAGLKGSLELSPGKVSVTLEGEAPLPAFVRLSLVHPTRSGSDRTLELRRVAGRSYEAAFDPTDRARRRLVLEDPAGQWRVTGVLAENGSKAVLSASP